MIDYIPCSLALSIIQRFLLNPSLVIGADALADEQGVTAVEVRRALAPAVGRHILQREANDLTGEHDYVAGRELDSMSHLLPSRQEPCAIVDNEQPPHRQPLALQEVRLASIPYENARLPGSRYDEFFEKALATGQAITLPPQHVHSLGSTARDWVKRRQIKAKVRSRQQMPGADFGCIWILRQKS